ncbi:MAG TPA: UbiD family decarboxylase [Candidatus Krumholzibacteria bacterium]|nr:UbiD family decarboxylase [Candidatus Krumholzibacteria bacterium]
MRPFDLRTFLLALESHGDLKRVRVDVDPRFEIAEIAQRMVREGGPALLFERVNGSRYPLAINFFGTFERIERALGMHPEALGERIVRFAQELNPPTPRALWNARDFFPRLLAFRPRRVSRAPAQTITESAPNLDDLPVITCWPGDGGRFITFPLVVSQHPVHHKTNVGIYRMQVFDRATTGMHWQIHKGGGFHYHVAEQQGSALPVAVALGADPALMLAGIFPLPEALEEIAFAGILSARRTRLVAGRTVPIDVPADAEFVLEGVVPPYERRAEGPFGDHFGHYCDVADFPVFRVKTITRRRDAIYPAAVVGKPPQEDRYMGDASQMILGPLIRLIRPEVRDVWAYYQAGFHNLLVASVESRYTREPVRTALGLLGEGQLGLSKVLIMVDASVNARDFNEVLQAIRQNFDPREHFHLISRAPLDTLDFTSFKMHHGSRMILDATGSRAQYSGGASRPQPARHDEPDTEPGPVVTRAPKDIAPHVKRWRLLEDTLLVVQLDQVRENIGREALEMLVQSPATARLKMIAVVSPDVNLDDDVDALWGIFTRFDPARDLMFGRAGMHGVQPVYEGVMGIDATWKPGYPEAVAMPDEVVKRVESRWHSY